jgi:hypothetical protein
MRTSSWSGESFSIDVQELKACNFWLKQPYGISGQRESLQAPVLRRTFLSLLGGHSDDILV